MATRRGRRRIEPVNIRPAPTLIASGFGDANANGIYTNIGTLNTQPDTWANPLGYYMWLDFDLALSVINNAAPPLTGYPRYNRSPIHLTGSYSLGEGTAPAGTVTQP